MRIFLKNRDVGKVYTRHDGNLHKTVFRSYRTKEHFCCKHSGFGVSVAVYNELQERGVQEIEIDYEGANGYIFRIPLAKFGEIAVCDKLGDFEPQLFVPAALFERKRVAEVTI